MYEVDLIFRAGMNCLDKGSVSEAIEAFTTCIALSPCAMAFCYRGLAYYRLKEYEKARADYTKAIEFDDPSVPEIYYFRGTLNGLMENHKEAIQDLTKAIELKGADWLAEAYYYRGANFGALGEHDMAINDMLVSARAGFLPSREFLKAKGLKW